MNKSYKYIIIGGGIAGTTAAETIRQKDEKGSIALISAENKTLYSRVLLPKFLEGSFSEEKITLRKEDDERQKNIDFLLGQKVLSLDTKNKRLVLENDEILYEKLLIATGARSRKLEVNNEISYFQNFKDAELLKGKIKDIESVILLGASFNSLELAEAFSKNNIKVSLLVRGKNFLGCFMDENANKLIEDNLKKNNVSIFFEEEFGEIEKKEGKKYLISKKGNKFEYDLLVASIGTELNIDFLKGSGIKTEKGVLTDMYLKTNIDDVFAAGDVAEFYDIYSEKCQLFRNWVFAFMQGKIAGLNMLGENNVFRHVSGYNVVNFGLNISILGDVSLGDGVSIVNRGDVKKNKYSRLFIKDGRLKGAIQLNMNTEQRLSVKLIEEQVDLSGYIKDLGDINFDLKEIIK